MRALLLVLLLTLPAGALAGAWARGEGKAFVSGKVALTPGDWEEPEPTIALYGEYGLTPRLTLGASLDKLDPPYSLAKLFARWNLAESDATWQIALEAGGGIEFDDTALGFEKVPFWRPVPDFREPGLRTYLNYTNPTDEERVYYDNESGEFVTLPAEVDGVPVSFELIPRDLETTPATGALLAAVHLGRGFGTPFGNGWTDMRLGAELPLNDDPVRLKLDATTGVSLGSGHLLMLDLRHTTIEDASYTSLGPATAIRLGERLHVAAGLLADVSGELPTRIELGAWLSF